MIINWRTSHPELVQPVAITDPATPIVYQNMSTGMDDSSFWLVHDTVAVSSCSQTVFDIIKPLDEIWVKRTDLVDNLPLDIHARKIAGGQLSVFVVLPAIFLMRSPTRDHQVPHVTLGNNLVPRAVNPTIRQEKLGLDDPDLLVGISCLLKDTEGITNGIGIVAQ